MYPNTLPFLELLNTIHLPDHSLSANRLYNSSYSLLTLDAQSSMTGNLKLLCNFVEKFLEPVLHQWTSVHNSSELGIKTTAMNRQFKVVPNVVSSSCQTATSPTSVGNYYSTII
ncbi:hypothetical protein Tco_1079318 [Tanacetum coccineum]|uniref:Uncharacterized protein n=1 Tax=Tanacetum coccineum TaxID=301880 RepID=A0ABQ5HTH9_9ASTR